MTIAAIRRNLVLSLAVLPTLACPPAAPPDARKPAARRGSSVAMPSPRPASGTVRERFVYVPAYSHVPSASGERDIMMSVLLSIRNVDPAASITLKQVEYFDTSGHRVRRYLTRGPRTLRPLETTEFHVTVTDAAGGSGANFLVYWEGPSDAHAPLTESVMVGRRGAGSIAFTSRGIELEQRPAASAAGAEPTGSPPDAGD